MLVINIKLNFKLSKCNLECIPKYFISSIIFKEICDRLWEITLNVYYTTSKANQIYTTKMVGTKWLSHGTDSLSGVPHNTAIPWTTKRNIIISAVLDKKEDGSENYNCVYFFDGDQRRLKLI